MNKPAKTTYNGIPSTFAELVAMHPPRPIHTEAAFDAATAIVTKIAGHQLNTDQDDYLDLLTTLIIQYDQQHHALQAAKMKPLQALQYLLDENGMNASDLGRIIGNRALGSKILRGERELSKAHITAIARRFSVGVELFWADDLTPKPKTRRTRKLPAGAPGRFRKSGTSTSHTRTVP